jgi:hypothetical protein
VQLDPLWQIDDNFSEYELIHEWAALPMTLDLPSPWGILPVAVALATLVAFRLGAMTSRVASPGDGALHGAVLALALVTTSVRVLGGIGRLSRATLFGGLVVTALVLLFVRRDRRLAIPWRDLVSRATAPVVGIGTAGVALAVIAAYFLPVWQWDSLGYHLPYVNFALQRGSLADLPADVPYLSTYPHAIEQIFAAWRAMLPDDRLVDTAQIPLALLGAAAIAVLARRFGARRDHAFAAGLLWLALPAVFLQLPTNYVDVASASLLLVAATLALSESTVANVVIAGVALGLFMASKPNAPVGTMLVFAVLAARAWKADRRASLFASAACVVVFGGESYLVNIARYGNPIWPVRLALGPISLPGMLPIQVLLDAGCAAPRLHGPMPLRILRSWTSLDAPPAFDMRYGGLGLVFLAALPVAVVGGVRLRSFALPVICAATLGSPDPAVARYILAFPGIVFALAAARTSALSARASSAVFACAAAAAVFGLVRAYPGLSGEGPPLTAYLHMTDAERLRAVGANGSPGPFYDAIERLGPGDETAYDAGLELPYLAWPPDLSHPAVRIPDEASAAELDAFLENHRLRLFMVDDTSPIAKAAGQQPHRFAEILRCPPRIVSCVAGELVEHESRSCVGLLRM